MVAIFLKIFKNESLRWVVGISVPIVISVTGFIITTWRRFSKKRDERIQHFVDNFCDLYKNNGYKLEVLIPAGINILKNNKEIQIALDRLSIIKPGHPLRNWKNRVEKNGYKKFFYRAAKSGGELNKHSIESLLNSLENG